MLDQVLLELALLFALCVLVSVSFHRLRLPPIVGFLFAGVLVGPHSIGLVRHEATVRELAEVGVIVLLFAVGLEVPLQRLARMRQGFLTGGAQVLLTVGAAALGAWWLGATGPQAVFLGFLVSLSSTAAVSKILVDQGEFSTPHGRQALGVCIAQDLAVVPMVMVMPLLASGGTTAPTTPWSALLGLALLAAAVFVTRLVLPRTLELVCRTRSRELFVLLLGTLCLAMAVLTAQLGMSLALGAFLAGILLADTDYHSQAAAEVEPFRDAFASLFFVSIGMLFDWRVLVESPTMVLLGLAAVVLGKAALVVLAAAPLGQPLWVRLRAGLVLAQVGEFSFVLMQLSTNLQLMPPHAERVFLVVAVLSIAATPLLHRLGAVLAQAHGSDDEPRPGSGNELRDHAIVVGYGPTGRAVVQGLRAVGVLVVAAEMNAATVKAEKQLGVPIMLGDATRVPVLRSLGIDHAHLLVLAVNDAAATVRIARLVRQLAPHVHIVARVNYNHEVAGLRRAGAHEIVPQELEASVEMLVRVLRRFLIADDEIGNRVREVRQAHDSERVASIAPAAAARIHEFVPGINFAIARLEAGAEADGKSLAQVGVRRRTGCSVVAVRRDGSNLRQVVPETVLQAGDTVVVIGPEVRLPDAAAMFRSPGLPENARA